MDARESPTRARGVVNETLPPRRIFFRDIHLFTHVSSVSREAASSIFRLACKTRTASRTLQQSGKDLCGLVIMTSRLKKVRVQLYPNDRVQ